jgi:hypothetical protein
MVLEKLEGRVTVTDYLCSVDHVTCMMEDGELLDGKKECGLWLVYEVGFESFYT